MLRLKTGGLKKARWLIPAIALIVIAGVFLGFLVPLLELLMAVVLPAVGCAVLAWFGYKLLLQPVVRQRKLDRIREDRSRRAVSHQDEPD